MDFLKELAIFATGDIIPSVEYRYALLNYYGALIQGANTPEVDLLVKYHQSDGNGEFSPLQRKERLSLSQVVEIDCFSSAVLAYDDIHYDTTTHPCGPVASAILGVARKQTVTLLEAAKALCVGMEVLCRIGVCLFKNTDASGGWYTTGVVGTIGAAVAAGRLYGFTVDQMMDALALASCFASGSRGSHGSLAGSYIPAIAASNGFKAAGLVKNGFTCNKRAFESEDGLMYLIAKNPNRKEALEDLGTKFISKETVCKPYPYGFISFAMIDCLKEIPKQSPTPLRIEVSSRCMHLGANVHPQNNYDGLVSLVYIASRVLENPENCFKPLKGDFMITGIQKEWMEKITLKEDPALQDNQARVSLNNQTWFCEKAAGADFDSEQIMDKFIHNSAKSRLWIEAFLELDSMNILDCIR